jgi:hypothetical protein
LLDWFKTLAQGGTDAGPETISSSSMSMEEGAIKENSEIKGLYFADAIAAHRKWKLRLAAYINGTSTEQLDHNVICKDNQCVLGKWIYGEGETLLSHLLAFQEMKVSHAQFHLIAGKIVELVKSGNKSVALELLEQGKFAYYSARVQSQLAELFVEIYRK